MGALDGDSAGMLVHKKDYKKNSVDSYAFSNASRLIVLLITEKMGKFLPKCISFLKYIVFNMATRSI